MKKIFGVSLSILFVVLMLVMGVKGYANDPSYFDKTLDKRVGGPFEGSNSTSRYALTQSIVDNNSVSFTDKQATLATPDLALSNKKYYTIFTPGISFLGVPFYLMGKTLGLPQIGAYTLTIVLAVINFSLIIVLMKKFVSDSKIGVLSGLIFTFATSAFAYAFTYTQHHASVTVLLLSLILALGKRTTLSNLALGLVFGAGLLIDIPNAFLLLPSVAYALSQQFSFSKIATKLRMNMKLNIIALLIGLLPMLFIIGKYNQMSTGSPTKLMQFVGRIDYQDENERSITESKTAQRAQENGLPFDTRLMLDGAKTLVISNERGWLFFSPVLIFGVMGLFQMFKKDHLKNASVLLSTIILTNIIIYSMFGDPWGGWSFGARYLIPAASLMSIACGYALYSLRNKILLTIFFVLFFIYSVYINIAGGLTTTAVPPKQEAENLTYQISYTYSRNFELIENNQISSYLYNTYMKDLFNASTLLYLYTGIVSAMMLFLITPNIFLKKGAKYEVL